MKLVPFAGISSTLIIIRTWSKIADVSPHTTSTSTIGQFREYSDPLSLGVLPHESSIVDMEELKAAASYCSISS